MIVGWQDCEFGAPEIDPKRPYGNSSVILDIAEILDDKAEKCPHCGEYFGDTDEDKLEELHNETETALQIVLSTKSFQPGKYMVDRYSHNWKMATS